MAEKIELNSGYLLPESIKSVSQSKDSGAYKGGNKFSKELAKRARNKKTLDFSALDEVDLHSPAPQDESSRKNGNKEKTHHDINHGGHVDIVI
jgi:hypothetical protein